MSACSSICFSLLLITVLSSTNAELLGIDSFATKGTANLTGSMVTLNILEGASVQGNPSFDPSRLIVFENATNEVLNMDSVPHTVTSGKGPIDKKSGKLFDTGIIGVGDLAYLNTSDLYLGTGNYPYYCSVHPYMKGEIRITNTLGEIKITNGTNPFPAPQPIQQPSPPDQSSSVSSMEPPLQSQTPSYQPPPQQQLFAPPQSLLPAPQSAENGLVILSQTSYVDSIGMTHIVGEIQNVSYDTANFVKVLATFYNRFNQVIGTQTGFTDPADLYSGQRAPFTILLSKGSMPSYEISYYTLNVDSS